MAYSERQKVHSHQDRSLKKFSYSDTIHKWQKGTKSFVQSNVRSWSMTGEHKQGDWSNKNANTGLMEIALMSLELKK